MTNQEWNNRMIRYLVGLIVVLCASNFVAAQDLESYDYNGGVSLTTEAYPVGQTINDNYSLLYWVVEYSGKDAEGNWHRWREEITAEAGSDRLYIIQLANDSLLEKIRNKDEQANGFLKAIHGGQHASETEKTASQNNQACQRNI